eukprot:CAMPEP_0201521252 /NCGR_PEP_ID=MMETSP0161_2-20130828/14314_1 /ASSEMBLY_ACC=CAM_ASM_000251 /TAXON_ID=180227 /ORGANISM="Neoparamoeba aestuarina, Strain SoJaBio B1-5/56/2" /LENGTH=116 /DNA_ID=CAMNT_0047919861 /DNA_START=67 /DNA_END=413 /DNA_ORIENTATION=+
MGERVDQWVLQYESLGKKCDELFSEINQRNRMKRANIQAQRGGRGVIVRRLKDLNEQIAQLSDDLERDCSAGRITMKEFHKRQDCLEAVISRHDRLQTMLGRDDERQQLFGGLGEG